MSEQGQPLASESNLADLATFLEGTPGQEPEEQETAEPEADEPTAEGDTGEEADSGQEDDGLLGDEPTEDEEPAPAEKITVKVKNEDGTEESVEFTPEELPKAVMRQKDYTKKTQALAERENEAVKFFTQKHEEVRSHYLQQAELTRAAIVSMAGIKSEAEMAQLAHSDPAAWVAEQQRQKQISDYIGNLDKQIAQERQASEAQRQAMQKQALDQQYKKAWEVLEQQKIDKAKLADIYGKVTKNYGFNDAELSNVYDHRLVLMMRDAAAYRELQSKRTEVTKKAEAAPRMPTRQSSPAQERRAQVLENKFKNGRAKLQDLADYLR